MCVCVFICMYIYIYICIYDIEFLEFSNALGIVSDSFARAAKVASYWGDSWTGGCGQAVTQTCCLY